MIFQISTFTSAQNISTLLILSNSPNACGWGRKKKRRNCWANRNSIAITVISKWIWKYWSIRSRKTFSFLINKTVMFSTFKNNNNYQNGTATTTTKSCAPLTFHINIYISHIDAMRTRACKRNARENSREINKLLEWCLFTASKSIAIAYRRFISFLVCVCAFFLLFSLRFANCQIRCWPGWALLLFFISQSVGYSMCSVKCSEHHEWARCVLVHRLVLDVGNMCEATSWIFSIFSAK